MKRLDFAVPCGLLIGLVAIGASAWLEGIRLGFLLQPTAALVVIGGTIGAVVVRRGVGGLKDAARASFGVCVPQSTEELEATLARLAWLAKSIRREGVQMLENHAEKSRDPLVIRGLTLTAEYADARTVRAALDALLDHEDERGMRDVATIEAAGSYAPTFGILGAVLGLIHVLRSLADPGALGSGIATAFIATIYGVGLANLLLFPLASRMRERHESHIKQRELLADALVALAAHEPPSQITNPFAAYAALNAPRSALAQAAPKRSRATAATVGV